MLKEKIYKILSCISSASLILNTFIAPVSVLAQEVTAEPTPVETSISETTTTTDTTLTQEVNPTIEVTPIEEVTIPEEITPTEEPIPTEEVTPTPTSEENTELSAEVIDTTLTTGNDTNIDLSYSTSEGSATLQTDKPDYAPSEMVVISGSGFAYNTIYSIEITSTGNYKFSDRVTSDESGGLFYTHQLDGTFRPQYNVEIKDASGSVVSSTTFSDTNPPSGCVIDTAGANDEPGQKDLTKMCADYAGLPSSIYVTWNWDETGWPGNNTGDGCSLYDTDGDGNANYSLCVTVEHNPATYKTQTLYSCGDDSAFKCTQPLAVIIPSATTCGASVQATTDPFPAGASYPNDTVANCTVGLSDVGGAGIAELIDVCSYPSQQPNSDPSDCVVYIPQSGKLEVRKVLNPSSDLGLFNLQIDGNTEATNVGNGGTTGEKVLPSDNHTVGEIAGTNTNLGIYSTNIICKDGNGTGNIIAQATGTGPLTVNLQTNADVICVIENSLSQAGITVKKNLDTNNDGQVDQSNVSTWTWDLDTGNQNYQTGTTQQIQIGSHTISEDMQAGWHVTDLTCGGQSLGAVTSSLVNVAQGGLDCTFTNARDTGTIKVYKDVQGPAGENITDTSHNFTVTLDGGSSQVLTDGGNYSYLNVPTGTHTINESVIPTGYILHGYSQDSDVVTPGAQVTVTKGVTTEVTVINYQLSVSVTIHKNVINPDGSEVSDSHQFTVQKDGSDGKTISEINDAIYSVNPGSYTFTELADGSYTLNSITGDNDGNPANGAVITAVSGGTYQLTFVNKQKKADIVVHKDVVAPDGTTDVSDNHSFTTELNGANDQSFSENSPYTYQVNPGTYTIIEVNDANYENLGCKLVTGGLATDFVIGSGASISVTCKNKQKTARITIVKDVRDPQGGDVTDNATFEVNQVSGQSKNFSELTSVYYDVNPGTYTFTESAKGGYTLHSINPDNNVNPSDGTTVTVGSNGSLTITFTNYQNYGSISGFKFEDSDGSLGTIGDRTGVLNWVIELWGCNSNYLNCSYLSTTNTGANGAYSFSNIIPGYFKIKEILQNGWTNLTSLFQNVSVNPGGAVNNVNFINFENVKVKACKVSDADGNIGTTGDQAPIESWYVNLLVDGQVNDTKTTGSDGCYTWDNLGPGHTYGVSEQVLPGWTARTDVSHSFGRAASGSEYVFTFVNTQNGKIIVKKETSPESEVDFNFSASYNTNGFTLSDGETNDSGNLLPGTYSISEVAKGGWDLTNTNCVSSINDTEVAGSLHLNAGEVITCTFTNTQRAHIVIEKNAIPDSSQQFTFQDNFGNGNPSTFGLTDDSTPGYATRNFEVLPGTYAISENPVIGWQSYESVSCDSDETIDAIDVAAGETVTCTFVNEKLAKIILVKNTLGGNGTFDFSMTGEGLPASAQLITSGNTDSETFSNLDADNTYSISETVPSGWDLTGSDCTGSNSPDEITPNAGEEVTCTFTNTQRGEVLITKYNDINGNGTQDQGEPGLPGWDLELTKTDFSETETSGVDGLATFGNLVPDGYTLSETIPTGWIQTNITCDNGSYNGENDTFAFNLTAGNTVNCKIGNFELAKINACKYQDLNGNGVLDSEDLGAPIEGVPMILTKVDDPNWTPIVQNTSESCCTTFKGLTAGEYKVEEDVNDPSLVNFYSSNGIIQQNITIVSGSNETANFIDALYRSISGFKYEDVNNNGQRDEGEPGLEGWTIYLDLNYNDQLDNDEPSTLTDVNGYYLFSNLVADSYRVREVIQPDWLQTEPELGYYDVDGHVIVYLPDNNFGNFLPQPSLTTIKTNIGGEEILVGETAVFEVQVQNTGNVPLYNLEITDTFDTDYIDFVSSTPDSPTTVQEDLGADTTDYDGDGDTTEHIGVLTWNIASLNKGETITLTLNFLATTVTPDPDVATNGARTTACSQDTEECSQKDTLITDVSFANVEIDKLTASLTKTNDRSSGISAGDTVNYTLTVTNTSDIRIDNVEVYDVLPGGFDYVTGTTKVGGAAASDPSITNGKLIFAIGSLNAGESKVIEYQARTDGDLSQGTYTNLATCKGTVREIAAAECELVSSTVKIGVGGEPSANVGGEVLGYVLPATGSSTDILLFFLMTLLLGIVLKLFGKGSAKYLITSEITSDKIKQMIKKYTWFMTILVMALFISAKSALAISDTVIIQDLPEYMTTDQFKLSYSAFSNGDVTAKFYVRKDGDSYRSMLNGSVTGASGQVQTAGGSDIYNGDGRYWFKVEINGNSSVNDETTTTIDRSAPGPVSNYWKEKVAGGFYRLHWKTPDVEDFSRVLVYRSTSTKFTADGLTKVGEPGGARNSDVTWDNLGLDSNINYYYAVRAIDKAGNVSGIVADPETTTVLGTSATTTGTTEEVTNLPKESTSTVSAEEGENVLGEEGTLEPTSTPTKNIVQKVAQFAKDRTKITVGILGVVAIAAYFGYTRLLKKRK